MTFNRFTIWGAWTAAAFLVAQGCGSVEEPAADAEQSHAIADAGDCVDSPTAPWCPQYTSYCNDPDWESYMRGLCCASCGGPDTTVYEDVVQITAPADGAIAPHDTFISLQAKVTPNVVRVVFLVDGQRVGHCTPYHPNKSCGTQEVLAYGATYGTHTLTAVAYDGSLTTELGRDEVTFSVPTRSNTNFYAQVFASQSLPAQCTSGTGYQYYTGGIEKGGDRWWSKVIEPKVQEKGGCPNGCTADLHAVINGIINLQEPGDPLAVCEFHGFLKGLGDGFADCCI